MLAYLHIVQPTAVLLHAEFVTDGYLHEVVR